MIWTFEVKSLFLLALLISGCRPFADHQTATFTNPLYRGQDPFIMKHSDGFYYYCEAEEDRIMVWKSDKLTARGTREVVWKAPEEGWNCSEVWAPELHFIRGRWYIYYAADSGENIFHRTGVLEGVTEDPQGEYMDRGMVYTGDEYESRTNNRWAIDATPLELNGRLYLIWSGWYGAYDDDQCLYIAPMHNPCTVSGNRIRIANNNDYVWERLGDTITNKGLNEGPQVLRNRDRIYLIYSCSGSWQITYKLGQLSLVAGADPLIPENWTKKDSPVFQGTAAVLGVGHASFTKSPDDSEDWIFYHSKIDTTPGWDRDVRIQPFKWNSDGSPDFGMPVNAGEALPLPSGEEE